MDASWDLPCPVPFDVRTRLRWPLVLERSWIWLEMTWEHWIPVPAGYLEIFSEQKHVAPTNLEKSTNQMSLFWAGFLGFLWPLSIFLQLKKGPGKLFRVFCWGWKATSYPIMWGHKISHYNRDPYWTISIMESKSFFSWITWIRNT